MKKLYLFFLLLMLFLFTSCSAKQLTLEEIKKTGKLIVTTNAEFAPFEYKDGLDLAGIDIDIIREYAKYINVEADIRDVDFDAALLSVSTNKSDLAIAAITKSPAREETLSFSNSYYTASQVLVVRKNSIYESLSTKEDILSALSNNNATIGCQRGTTGEYFIEGDADWEFDGISNTTCVTYDSGILAIKALSNNQIDAVIIDKAPATLYCSSFPNTTFLNPVLTYEEYSIAVSKNNTTLIESLNQFIKEMEENGTFDRIISKHYGQN